MSNPALWLTVSFGELLLDFRRPEAVSAYRRELDIETAPASVTYQVGDVLYRRKLRARLRIETPGDRVWLSSQDAAEPVLENLDDGLLELELTAGSKWHITAATKVEGVPEMFRDA